ncbi:TRAP-type mannitol/chloroaromatic compound transport system substrate-binding protein OS=Castellaniella defragrans OX=75697 GN=HNR28_003438 PE=4 SV=1 [Castellaniella defragrans]
MRRRAFLKKAGLGAMASTAVVAAPAVAQSGVRIDWKMTSTYGPAQTSLFATAQRFCAMVRDMTGGDFDIRLYPAGELVPGFGVMDAVSKRTVECGQTASYYYYGKDPSLCFDTAMPFGLNTRQMNAWMNQGDGMKLMRELFAPHHIVNFPFGNTGAQMGGWYRKEIKTVDDLKGLKMRTAGFAGEVLSRLGVVPQQVAPSEIYPLLEKGTLDAAEFVGPLDDEKLGFQKVAKYYYYPGWWAGEGQVSLYVNDAAFAELSKPYQAVLAAAARAAAAGMVEDYDALNPEALRRLIAGGALLRAFPRDIMDAAFKASGEAYQESCDKNAGFKKIFDNYMGFRDNIVPWFRVAEGSFDNYLGTMLARQSQKK